MSANVQFRKIVIRVFSILLIISASGWFSAQLGLSKCISITEQELKESGLTSRNFDGDLITYKEIKVSGEITYPFIVTTHFMTPQGLHGDYFITKYFVFFGFVKQYDYITYSTV